MDFERTFADNYGFNREILPFFGDSVSFRTVSRFHTTSSPTTDMSTQQKSLRDANQRENSIRWSSKSPLTLTVETRKGDISTRHGRFVGGLADGVEVIEIDTGEVRIMLLPTRGMSIWYVESHGIRFGWKSPVAGPIHPSNVPLHEPSGLGWLAGFDELVARCGLESNGAPEHDAQGQLIYPLHGCIGNLAADGLSIEYDEASGRLEVIGEVFESKLFFKRLRLRSRLRVTAGGSEIELLDDVTNQLSSEAEMQLLYHVNVGAPLLGEGATLHAAVAELAPKDALSASELSKWNQYAAPESGYSERVYFTEPVADEHNRTTVMLQSAEADKGLGVSFGTTMLPKFVLWKNTGSEHDGYVTGLEPATNLPNTRSFEASQGRVVKIPPRETVSFRVTLHPLTDSESVAAMADQISQLAEDQPSEIHNDPKPGWSEV